MLLANAITAFIGFSVASAATLKVRSNAATVIADLETVNADIQRVQQDVQAYNGQNNQNQQLLADIQTLNNQIQVTTTDARNSANFDAADSTEVTNAINIATPSVVNVLNSLQAKANAIAQAGFSSQDQNAVKSLQTSTDNLLAAIESRVDSSDAATVRGDQQKIDVAFNAAIAAL